MDLVSADQQEDYFFETDLMLGKLDESHIIRAIEYWDLETSKKTAKFCPNNGSTSRPAELDKQSR